MAVLSGISHNHQPPRRAAQAGRVSLRSGSPPCAPAAHPQSPGASRSSEEAGHPLLEFLRIDCRHLNVLALFENQVVTFTPVTCCREDKRLCELFS
jgi:hypothetical protein